MKPHRPALVLGLLAAAGLSPQAWAAPGIQPNIVFVLADNLGYGELGCYGGDVLRD
jgi:hypothetical protein